MEALPQWAPGEELANAITHGIGAPLSIIALISFIIQSRKAHNGKRLFATTVFAASLIIMYWNSTLYHSIPAGFIKKILRYGDHISIYLLIAGSYTPFTMLVIKGYTGIFLTIAEWSIAIFGITMKIVNFDAMEKYSLYIYILMGWMVVFSFSKLKNSLPHQGLMWLVAGGLSYTVGCYFYANPQKIPFAHAVWHLFVLAGSICHYVCVLLYTSDGDHTKL